MSSELRCEQNQNRKPHFKLKSNLINKFFNETVDALDLRLDKAEATLSSFQENPLEIKLEEIESDISKHIEQLLHMKVNLPTNAPLVWKTDQQERSFNTNRVFISDL